MLGLSISISNAITGQGGSVDAVLVLVEAYKARVIADGGTYENNDCLVAALNNLDSI